MQKILKIRRHFDEDMLYIIPNDVANETTLNLLKDFIVNNGHGLPDLSEVHLVDVGDFIDLEDQGIAIIAEVAEATVI